jgi:hypothetical protein
MSTIAILTGAGISAESGLATFRDNNGLWCNHRIEDVATPEAEATAVATPKESFFNFLDKPRFVDDLFELNPWHVPDRVKRISTPYDHRLPPRQPRARAIPNAKYSGLLSRIRAREEW